MTDDATRAVALERLLERKQEIWAKTEARLKQQLRRAKQDARMQKERADHYKGKLDKLQEEMEGVIRRTVDARLVEQAGAMRSFRHEGH